MHNKKIAYRYLCAIFLFLVQIFSRTLLTSECELQQMSKYVSAVASQKNTGTLLF
jgi:hypothetical protein